MNKLPLHLKLASIFSIGLGMALLTTVAGTNIMVLLLLCVAPWAWIKFQMPRDMRSMESQLLILITALCFWSILSNVVAGYGAVDVSKALVHDMRTFAFIILLWPLFVNVQVSRAAFWALLCSVVALASVNLALTLSGHLEPGRYFWQTAPHMYGQILVGFFFLLAQMLLTRPSLSWRVILPMALLLMSLFFASERRTGYLQFAAGFFLWVGLNRRSLFIGKYRWWFVLSLVMIGVVAITSPIVQRRMHQALFEVYQFINQTPEERAAKELAVGIRLQFAFSTWELIKQNNFFLGVGSIGFSEAFWLVNQKMGATQRSLFGANPHNEYLYTLATKGAVGLVLYLTIFAQACRMAWHKTDSVQRIGLIVFVFLFMLSIFSNSMMIDMEEGHFAMLTLLIFLAPQSLDLVKTQT
jgi:O-antigen ligase